MQCLNHKRNLDKNRTGETVWPWIRSEDKDKCYIEFKTKTKKTKPRIIMKILISDKNECINTKYKWTKN